MPDVFGNPVLVYQMGKVGSQSICHSLSKCCLPGSLHHIHLLSHEKLRKCQQHTESLGNPPNEELEHGLAVRQFLDSQPTQKAYVITAVREPVAQLVSAFFQNARLWSPALVSDDGKIDVPRARKSLQEALRNYDVNTHWNCNWFTDDFLPALNVDIYKTPFDHHRGYITIEHQNLSILCLRLESNAVWRDALGGFLNLCQRFQLSRRNDADNKSYAQEYRQLKSDLRIPREVLLGIYSTPYVRHFYTPEMVEHYLQQWSEPKTMVKQVA